MLTDKGGAAVSTTTKKFTPGYKSILISEEAFDALKKLQKRTYGHSQDPNALLIDLKYVASEVIKEAMKQADLPERALSQAARVVIDSFMPPKENTQ